MRFNEYVLKCKMFNAYIFESDKDCCFGHDSHEAALVNERCGCLYLAQKSGILAFRLEQTLIDVKSYVCFGTLIRSLVVILKNGERLRERVILRPYYGQGGVDYDVNVSLVYDMFRKFITLKEDVIHSVDVYKF